MSLLSLFAVGVVEYLLAAWWTQALIARNAPMTSTVTFVSVLLWGFVITQLEPGAPWRIVAHGLGCALGAGIAARWSPSDKRTEPAKEGQ